MGILPTVRPRADEWAKWTTVAHRNAPGIATLGKLTCTHTHHTNLASSSAVLARWAPGLNDAVATAIADTSRHPLRNDNKQSEAKLLTSTNTKHTARKQRG